MRKTKTTLWILTIILLTSLIYAQELAPNKNPDFDNNGIVGYSDYFMFLDNFRQLTTEETEKFDLNDDKRIDADDLSIFRDWFKVCNEDITCNSPRENYKNCPQDCSSGSKDDYCDQKKDDICDSDCTKATDIDCKKPSNQFWLIIPLLMGAILIIMLFLFFEIYTKRSEKIQKQRDEELELRTYIMSSTNQGYTKQQIRKMLLEEGWKKKIINEAFKTTKEPEKLSKIQLLELQNYILSTKKMKYKDKQIKKELRKDGWTDKQIDQAFNRLKSLKR